MPSETFFGFDLSDLGDDALGFEDFGTEELETEELEMTDLHLHFDGSIPLLTLQRIFERQQGVYYTIDELREIVEAPRQCPSLNEYLECFTPVLALLQTPDAIEEGIYDLHRALQRQRVDYAEIRFAPSLFTYGGFTQAEMTEAALFGRMHYMQEHEDVLETNFILCAMRGEGIKNMQDNFETVRVAAKFARAGVVALDLAGDEALYPTSNFIDVFELARKRGVPYTIHAGEAAGPKSVWEALEMGASRIGHGIRSLEDPNLMRELSRRQIPLELCPSSNLDTKVVQSLSNYPIRQFLAYEIPITINTDNMTVSHTTLQREYDILQEALGLTQEEIDQLKRNAYKARFA